MATPPAIKNTRRREVDDHETPSPAVLLETRLTVRDWHDYLTKNYPRENGMA